MPLRLTIRPADYAPDGAAAGSGASAGNAASPASAASAELVFDRDAVTLGRAASVDVRLPGAAVSLLHARLERAGDDWFVVDGGSTNGTRLNGTRLQPGQRRLVRSGDALEVPGFTVGVTLADGALPSTPEATQEVARRMVREVLQALSGGADAAPSLRVASGPQAGESLLLGDLGRAYLVGRADACDLRLQDRDASREHATLRRDWTGVVLVDMGAKNGVAVNGERLAGSRPLADGDELVIGATRLRFVDPAEAYLRELEAQPDPAASAPPQPLPPLPSLPGPPGPPPGPPPSALAPSLPPPSSPRPPPPPQPQLPLPPADAAPRPARPRGPLLLVLFAVVVALLAATALFVLVRS